MIMTTAVLGGATSSHARASTATAAAPAPSPMVATSFVLSIDGHDVAVFDTLVSISNEKGKKPTLVLRRFASSNIEMSAWHELERTHPDTAVKTVFITARASDGDGIMKFRLTKGFPSKIEVTADAKSRVIETVTLTGDKLERTAV